jgi:hypothetical protein
MHHERTKDGMVGPREFQELANPRTNRPPTHTGAGHGDPTSRDQ